MLTSQQIGATEGNLHRDAYGWVFVWKLAGTVPGARDLPASNTTCATLLNCRCFANQSINTTIQASRNGRKSTTLRSGKEAGTNRYT
jgi:hypothetical protein